jgi:16S rRNA (cytosine1402-N4)-methyltransferase
MEIRHVPVMSQEALDYLGPAAQQGLLIDCTCGEGGHSEMFLRHFPTMRLIGLDRDTTIQQKAAQRLSVFGERVSLINT